MPSKQKREKRIQRYTAYSLTLLELFIIEETGKSINAFYMHPAAVSQTINATARTLLQFPSLCQYLIYLNS